jgi:hypothetical protein
VWDPNSAIFFPTPPGEIGVLEEFAVIMYDRSSSTNKVNDASLDLFARKQRPYNGIPPSRAALVQHIKRSVLQAENLSNGILLLHYQTHSRPDMLSFYLFQQMQTRYHSL